MHPSLWPWHRPALSPLLGLLTCWPLQLYGSHPLYVLGWRLSLQARWPAIARPRYSLKSTSSFKVRKCDQVQEVECQPYLALLRGSDLGCLGGLACLHLDVAGLLLGKFCLLLCLVPVRIVGGTALQMTGNSVALACLREAVNPAEKLSEEPSAGSPAQTNIWQSMLDIDTSSQKVQLVLRVAIEQSYLGGARCGA